MSNKDFKISDYTVISQLKKKLKNYLSDMDCANFKISKFGHGIVLSMVFLLDEIFNDCIKLLEKDNTGLYIINKLVFNNCINSEKYDFFLQYTRKYSTTIRYKDSLLFNYDKALTHLESIHGEKIMIESDTKNKIAYLLLSLQYDLISLCISVTKLSGRKTLGIKSLLVGLKHIVKNDDFFAKINIKLDSITIDNNEKNKNDKDLNDKDLNDKDLNDKDNDYKEDDESSIESDEENSNDNSDEIKIIENIEEIDEDSKEKKITKGNKKIVKKK
jgi:hypothetical protein